MEGMGLAAVLSPSPELLFCLQESSPMSPENTQFMQSLQVCVNLKNDGFLSDETDY